MPKSSSVRIFGILCFAIGVELAPVRTSAAVVVAVDPRSSPVERFAAREIQRYLYLRSGVLPALAAADPSPETLTMFVGTVSHAPAWAAGIPVLPPGGYYLGRGRTPTGAWACVLGADGPGTLYGAYRVAETLGVRFYLSGDVIPDEPIQLDFSHLHEIGRPLFAVRGIQPFHDFAEGPDWWNADEYLSVIGQLPKLRMNFLGLHTYPEGDTGPEPTVWIGRSEDVQADGRVTLAYPASYQTTERGGRYWWTYEPTPTSQFVGGAANLFERDDFGADVMIGENFGTQTGAGSVLVFNRTAAMLGRAFAEARRLGVLTCVGTETPLILPKPLQAATTGAPDEARQYYRGIFERIAKADPVDYYWLWTTEKWTWEGNRPEEFAGTESDIRAALGALADLGHPFTLATSGWVLGPQHDRSALDHLLPADSPMSAINPAVGFGAIERQFANLGRRPRWAIPWLEDDPDLVAPQLWAGRMRYDAADALRLGCTGLIGIHWRTRVISPQISALAAAGWDQSWVPSTFDRRPIPPQTSSGADGGTPAQIGPEPGPASSVRVGMGRYDVLVPGGTYTVTLTFAERPEIRPGERVFGVRLQGKPVLEHLDLARDHRQPPAKFIFRGVDDPEGHILIDFVRERGEPAIAAIEIEGTTKVGSTPYARRINCGGSAMGDFEADQLAGSPRPPDDRAMPVGDFYRDFATANFGAGPAPAIGPILAAIDGVKLPRPANWIDGPGDILRNPDPWSTVARAYDFVGQLEQLRGTVRGAANLDRFDYWLNQFRGLRLMGELGCTAAALDQAVNACRSQSDPEARRQGAETRALPLRIHLAELWTQLMRVEVAGVSSPGELGTIANLEQRSRRHQQLLGKDDEALVTMLRHPLPAAAAPAGTYAGPPRIVVPSVRTSASAGESIALKVILVAAQPPLGAELWWRPAGSRDYQRAPLHPVDRWVYTVTLPAPAPSSPIIEYHIAAQLDGQKERWPISDRGMDQTVVMLEPGI